MHISGNYFHIFLYHQPAELENNDVCVVHANLMNPCNEQELTDVCCIFNFRLHLVLYAVENTCDTMVLDWLCSEASHP